MFTYTYMYIGKYIYIYVHGTFVIPADILYSQAWNLQSKPAESRAWAWPVAPNHVNC